MMIINLKIGIEDLLIHIYYYIPFTVTFVLYVVEPAALLAVQV